MSDKELTPLVPRSLLAARGTQAVMYLAAGAFLLLMAAGARLRFLGIILAPTALVLGIAALLSKDSDDKKPGLVLAAAGVLGMAARFGLPLIRPFAVFALGLGALGFFTAGIWKGIVFLRGLNALR